MKGLSKLKTVDKIAIGSTIVVVLILGLSIWKQFIFDIGRTGSSSPLLRQFLHHSRWGALMAMIGSVTILITRNKKIEMAMLVLIIIGVTLVVQHLATEQCFSLFTNSGGPAGGFC